jgi:hypothetical protein
MKLGRRLSGICLLDPVGLPAAAAPGLAVLVFQLKTAVSLVVLLAATVTTAAGLAVAAGRLRLRPGPPPARGPSVRAVPEPGPPGQLDVHSSGQRPLARWAPGRARPLASSRSARELGCWPPVTARPAAAPPRRYRGGPMPRIDSLPGIPFLADGGFSSRATARRGLMCRVSTSCATAPLTAAEEKDVPLHVAYPLAL